MKEDDAPSELLPNGDKPGGMLGAAKKLVSGSTGLGDAARERVRGVHSRQLNQNLQAAAQRICSIWGEDPIENPLFHYYKIYLREQISDAHGRGEGYVMHDKLITPNDLRLTEEIDAVLKRIRKRSVDHSLEMYEQVYCTMLLLEIGFRSSIPRDLEKWIDREERRREEGF